MEHSYSKLDVAIIQLDRAIQLFLDDSDFVSAITLAGACDEIIGKALGDQSSASMMRDDFATELSMKPREVMDDHLNKTRNFVKHYGGSLYESHTTTWMLQALQMILRAASNLSLHRMPFSKERERFDQWVCDNFPP